ASGRGAAAGRQGGGREARQEDERQCHPPSHPLRDYNTNTFGSRFADLKSSRGDVLSGFPWPSFHPRLRPSQFRSGQTPKPSMANTTDVAADAAVPSSADIERASSFAREPFLLDGEGPEALAPGTARRRALDDALAEIAGGAEEPSIEWRRNYSLLLGLERFLAVEPPTLRDGAELSPHQVDALSGTLAELMAQAQVGSAEAAVELPNGEAGIDEPDTAEASIGDDAAPEGEDETPEDEPEDEEPQDWTETTSD